MTKTLLLSEINPNPLAVIYRKISELQKLSGNPRQIKSEDFKTLCKSLIDNPDYFDARPLILSNRTGELVIIAGNQRFEAAKENKLKKVPTFLLEGLTEAREREIIIRDNVNNGTWDWGVLANTFDIEELKDWGVDLPVDFGTELEAVEDDYEIPNIIETDIVLGDLFEIGKHRLLCGDSTCSDTVAKLMNGEKADMVFTDPPYGMFLDTDYDKMFTNDKGHNKTGKRFEKVMGDNNDFIPDLINTIFACFNDVKEIFIWGADYFSELIPDRLNGSWVVWDKRCDENMDKVSGNTFELCWSKQKHKRLIARLLWSGHHGMQKDDTKKRVHPTQKPSLLAQWFFNQWGKENDLIADIYLGSGTTMVASHQLNRKCYGMELDPKYCQVIVQRMLKLAPDIEIKLNGKKYIQKVKELTA